MYRNLTFFCALIVIKPSSTVLSLPLPTFIVFVRRHVFFFPLNPPTPSLRFSSLVFSAAAAAAAVAPAHFFSLVIKRRECNQGGYYS